MKTFLPLTFLAIAFFFSAARATGAEPETTADMAAALVRAEQAAGDAGTQAAIRILRNELMKDEEAPALRFALSSYLLEAGEIKAAAAELEKTLEIMPSFHRARLNLAQLNLQLDRPGKAAEHLVYLLDRQSGDKTRLYLLLAATRLEQQQPAAAESAYRQALLRNPENQEARLGLIQALIDQNRLRTAKFLAHQVLRTAPAAGDMWNLLAQAALEEQRPDDAIRALECARRLQVISPQALATLGDLYANRKMPSEALHTYNQLSQLADGTEVQTRLLRSAELLLSLGHLEEAESLIDGLGDKETGWSMPQRTTFSMLKAMLCRERGQFDCAVDNFQDVLEKDPLNGRALIHLGEIYLARGALSQAKILFDRAKHRELFRAPALVRLAQIALAEDDEELAVDLLEQSLAAKENPYIRDYIRRIRQTWRYAQQGKTGSSH